MFKKTLLFGSTALLAVGLMGCSDAPDETAPSDHMDDAEMQENDNQPDEEETKEETKDQTEKVEDVKQSRSSNTEQEVPENDSKPSNEASSNNDDDIKYTCSELEDMTTEEKANLSQDQKELHGISDDGKMYTECTNSKKQIEYNENENDYKFKTMQIANIWLELQGQVHSDRIEVSEKDDFIRLNGLSGNDKQDALMDVKLNGDGTYDLRLNEDDEFKTRDIVTQSYDVMSHAAEKIEYIE